ncbi:MAG: PD-(D/E)XK nuclease family protein [Pseudobutyrivibrio sp.]|nr:PD-(D/E)XK nuclease family protein [Pseudobutyrivibrio sp.]
MSLTFITGSSNSGKSTYIYQDIIDRSIKNKDENFLIIVPEQYTMSTQRLLVSMHPKHCIMNIDVLSFNRLAYRVFSDLGMETSSVLDDTGKSLVIRKLAKDHLDELEALGSNIKRISYITQVKSLISELTQYNITPEKLKDMCQCPSMSYNFKKKASDLLVLYQAFLDFVEGKYLTTETILSKLDGVMDSSDLFTNATIVLDGFTGFTPIQYQLVEHFLKLCNQVFVTITTDNNQPLIENKPEDDLFYMSSSFAIKMSQIAAEAKTEINETIKIDDSQGWLSDNPALTHLEKNIFRPEPKAFEGQGQDSISLVSLKSLRDELKYTAIEISKLIRQGHHYNEMAVVAPNLDSYRYLIPEIFGEFSIPFFIDAKSEVLFHPFSEMIDAIFDIVSRGYRREDVFRFLRTGMSGLPMEDIDFLENYVISTGIRGKKKYFHPFAIRSNSFNKDEDLIRANSIRESFIGPFISFDEKIDSRSTVKDIAVALYELLEAFDCQRKIKARGQEFQDRGADVKAKEYQQIYKVLMDILDKMVSIIGDEVLDLKDFYDIYKAGLSSAAMGLIPSAADSVIVGDIERTRLSNIGYLFCLGASDDAIPMAVENGGILSQLERQQLLDAGFEMAPTDKEKSLRQRFYLYLMLSKPNKKLFITMPRVNGEGKGVNPSYLFGALAKMFDIKLQEIENFSGDDRFLSRDESLAYLISLISRLARGGAMALSPEEEEDFNALYSWAVADSDIDLDSILDAAFYIHDKETISGDIMLAVNEAFNEDETVSGSITKFETYSQCAYKYFLTYILRLKEREEFKLSAVDLGIFCHQALEEYSKSLVDDGISWQEITESQIQSHIELALGKTYDSIAKVASLEDETQKYIMNTVKKTLRYTVGVITSQVKKGSFTPSFFEEKISCDVTDPETEETLARLSGKVDRIDISDSAAPGVRIIDYKSSSHSLDLNMCYRGLSLQLPIYMQVVLDKLKDKYPYIHPSAMLYYKISNDFTETKGLDSSSLMDNRFKNNSMDGLLSAAEADLRDNDATVGLEDGQEQSSTIVPYAINKDGSPNRYSKVMSQEGIKTLLDYSSYQAGQIAKHIIDGEFEPSPARLKSLDSCKYCKYRPVCGYRDGKPGYEARDFESISSSDEIISLMNNALETEGDK